MIVYLLFCFYFLWGCFLSVLPLTGFLFTGNKGNLKVKVSLYTHTHTHTHTDAHTHTQTHTQTHTHIHTYTHSSHFIIWPLEGRGSFYFLEYYLVCVCVCVCACACACV